VNATATGERQHAPVVTLAALYGAGGSVVGPRLAERLGVPLLDREIPDAVAKRLGLSGEAVRGIDEQPKSRVDRIVETLGRASTINDATSGSAEQLELQERRLRGYFEELMARTSETGGVVVGRGGMVVLRSVPWALHVHLAGPRELRLEQRMALEGIDRETAEQRQRDEDRARSSYVRRAYGVDGEDASLYHMVLDSTALGLDVCVDLIVAACKPRTEQPRAAAPG
jgi:cytidylate kinase